MLCTIFRMLEILEALQEITYVGELSYMVADADIYDLINLLDETHAERLADLNLKVSIRETLSNHRQYVRMMWLEMRDRRNEGA